MAQSVKGNMSGSRYTLRDPGYNFGEWNITERWNIEQVGPNNYTIDGDRFVVSIFLINW
ncbi:hypothetical protein DFP97_11375 [Paenibacillus prosopidis]|uniref:Uncharacterized protein n=1 Tax=Paenibacillus prosopidis TaxID=630520 RepID=A0A368VVE2_9BACL|nr:hypothetical protein DFP97_11375 [Paenibacillus prosopidis]